MGQSYHYTPGILPLLLAAALMFVIAVYAWRHRTVAGAVPFALMDVLIVFATLANVFELAASDLPTALFWRRIWFLCLTPVSLPALATALEYAGLGRRMTPRAWAFAASPVLVLALLMLTNDAHDLVWTQIWFDGQLLHVSRGVLNWLIIAYSYSLWLASVLVLARVAVRSRGLYRFQAILLGFGGLTGWLGMGLRFLDLDWMSSVAPSTIGLVLSGLIGTWGLFRFRVFDLAPVARDIVVEHMGDGMIVLDTQNRVVDLNPAAQNLLGIQMLAIGRDVALVFQHWQNLAELAYAERTTDRDIVFEAAGKWYDARAMRLTDSAEVAIGRLILLHDVTERYQAQAERLERQRVLAGLEERERLARELHDDLGQMISFINVQAQAVRKLVARGETARADEFLARLVQVAQDADAEIRDGIYGLRALGSLEHGFVSALSQYVERFGKTYGIVAKFSIQDRVNDQVLSDAAQVQLLRVIQEAMVNARKHAQAHRVQVTLSARDRCVQVVIEDDGQGFEPAGVLSKEDAHFGLRFMQERVKAVGGSLNVQSARGQGTRILVEIPLRRTIHEGAAG